MSVSSYWTDLSIYQSAEYTQAYLRKSYHGIGYEQADVKSYENCYPFMYYLQHAEAYYKQAQQAPITIQPVLLFYGYVHLIKACILSVDPLYPETTTVLAHGVTSRKKKKQNYRFIDDEVKIQKMGLCSHFTKKMFFLNHQEGDKYSMHALLRQVPELDAAFPGKGFFIDIEENHGKYYIPTSILDHFHMTAQRFSLFLSDKIHSPMKDIIMEEQAISISADYHLNLPFRFHLYRNKFCLPFRLNKESELPDMLIHYLLLYNLSMISRYETEWWAELINARETSDFPLIRIFLQIAAAKEPFLCLHFLNSRL